MTVASILVSHDSSQCSNDSNPKPTASILVQLFQLKFFKKSEPSPLNEALLGSARAG
jgi:hypothetical protein